ncbi:hypothetical protein LUZ60_011860 [Juncus effusus]|nr:hypothetical protein LUZ60_011860 [Juncus effusus]
MELSTILYTLLFLILTTTLILLRRNTKPPLPPGPTGLPLIGSLPFLDPSLHTYFVKLSQKYGPIFSLRLGSKLAVVISSPDLAKAVLKEQDNTFANRDVPAAARVLTYGGNDIVWNPNGPVWRMLRRVAVHEVLSPSSLDLVANLRFRELRSTVRHIHAKSNSPVDIGASMFLTMMNIITNTMWGGAIESDEERELIGKEFRVLVAQMTDLLGRPNLSDFFPLLARFDLQGVQRQMEVLKERLDKIFVSLIAKRESLLEEKEKDFLGFMLRLEKEGDSKTPFTVTHVKALLMDMVVGGTDTTSNTAEWAMAEMLKKPEILKKVQEELDRVVGKQNIVQESHLPQLHFLSLIIKETLRLHPVVPLLVPHCPSSPCTIDKYFVPAGTRVFINAWAIQRDRKNWTDPLEFKPERFLGAKRDFSGKDFDYLPFGSGRRICAGIALADRMAAYLLATLVHSFDWKIPEGSEINLEEKFGIVMKKAVPLVAIPTPRLSEDELYL